MEYKNEIIKLIKAYGIIFLVDVHGCSNDYGFDINIGTNSTNNLANKKIAQDIYYILSSYFYTEIDNKIKASKPYTISNYTHKNTGIDCIQLELSARVRNNKDDLNVFIILFEEIIDYIININKPKKKR